MREAHKQGIPGTATMMFGSVESLEDRVAHMRAIRDLQDETGGFRAFIPWSFQSGRTALQGTTQAATAVEYLMTLAVSRLYLDNVPHIQASWVTQGLKIGQVALRFGADDLGSTMIEENVVVGHGADGPGQRGRSGPGHPGRGFRPRSAAHGLLVSWMPRTRSSRASDGTFSQ